MDITYAKEKKKAWRRTICMMYYVHCVKKRKYNICTVFAYVGIKKLWKDKWGRRAVITCGRGLRVDEGR